MSEWIDVSEKLPGPFESVLISISTVNGLGNRVQYVTDGMYYRGRWISCSGDLTKEEYVTAWMPLPEPPDKVI